MNGLFALEHHVIAEDVRKPYLASCEQWHHGEEAAKKLGDTVMSHDFSYGSVPHSSHVRKRCTPENVVITISDQAQCMLCDMQREVQDLGLRMIGRDAADRFY